MLQIKQKWSASDSRAAAASIIEIAKSAIGALDSARAEAIAERGWRCVVKEAGDAIEDVAACEESAEDLRVTGVNPFATELKGVLALDEGEAVANVGAPKDFVNGWFEEEGLAEAEGGAEAHRGVWHRVLVGGVARTIFTRIGEVSFVELVGRNGAVQVAVSNLDFARAFNAVRG